MEELELKDGMKVICPIKTDIFTKGKEYVVYDVEKNLRNEFAFYIINNLNRESFCLLNECAHIKNKNWKIKQ